MRSLHIHKCVSDICVRAESVFPVLFLFFHLCQPGKNSCPVGDLRLKKQTNKKKANMKIISAHMLLYSACSGTETDQSCGTFRIIARNSVAILLTLRIIHEHTNAYSKSMLVTHSLRHLRHLSIDPVFSLYSSGETLQQLSFHHFSS